jgi:hemerythrin-like domain-containing protein
MGEKTATYYAPKGVTVERGKIVCECSEVSVASYMKNSLERALEAEWSTADAGPAQEIVTYDEYWEQDQKQHDELTAKFGK